MANKDLAVKVENLTKSFRIPLEASNGIKQKIINALKGRKGYREFTPLSDVSFEIEKGDFFGIVGRNGSGKSTLLKTLAGIYSPDGGAVHVAGKLVPFIELGVGFNPELSGRENVYLNGALLGFSRKEMEGMYEEIVDFAELHDFMEERLKNYSSGMQVRLAFSIAIRAQGDILLLDEVLAVGDEAFQNKSKQYFKELKSSGKTVILVTHDMRAVEEFCNKGILINDGKIQARGSNEAIAIAYKDLFEAPSPDKKRDVSPEVSTVKDIAVSMPDKDIDTPVAPGENITLNITLESSCDYENDVVLGINLKNSSGLLVSSFGLGGDAEPPLKISKGSNVYSFDIGNNIFQDDQYTVDILLVDYVDDHRSVLHESLDNKAFRSEGFKGRQHSLVHIVNYKKRT